MNDTCTYLVELSGQVDEEEIAAMSPIQVKVERVESTATLLSVCADQAGLIGLMRHLHGLGMVLLTVTRVDEP